MKVRPWCKQHNMPLVNVGNGRIFFPTTEEEPGVDLDGYWSVDFSEFACEFDKPLEWPYDGACDGKGWTLLVAPELSWEGE